MAWLARILRRKPKPTPITWAKGEEQGLYDSLTKLGHKMQEPPRG